MKRFVLFAGENYYPRGGVKDLVGSFDSLDEAKAALSTHPIPYERGEPDAKTIEPLAGDIRYRDYWWHIYDQERQEMAASWNDDEK